MSQNPTEVPDGAYCSVGDLRTGDIRLPSYISPEQRVQGAAEEIDIAIGHIYKTPVDFGDPVPLESRPSQLFLKKVNWLIASGRIILDMAAAGENQQQHAFGMGMLKEGLKMLEELRTSQFDLVGVPRLDDDKETKDFTGPAIHNEDPMSLVESFYSPRVNGYPVAPGMPYGIPPNLYGGR